MFDFMSASSSSSSSSSTLRAAAADRPMRQQPMLSASLADELYEEQQQRRQHQRPTFSTFINQPTPSPKSMASSIASALPFLNTRRDGDPEHAPVFGASNKNSESPLMMSASYMTAKSNDDSSSIGSSSRPPRAARRTPSPAMSYLSAETTWKRIQADKEREMDILQRYYHRRTLVHKQLGELRASISDQRTRLRKALTKEAYLEAESLQDQLEKTTTKWWDLFATVHEQLDHQIHEGWQRLAALVTRESQAAQRLADASQLLREEREQQQLQFQIDHERAYNERLQAIHEQRQEIENEQSEIAFEVEMWEQSHAEYKSRVDELVHKEKQQKEKLVGQVQDIQDEMDQLMSRLADLQQQQDGFRDQIQRLDQAMEQATRECMPERDALEKDRLNVEERRRILEEKTNAIDRRDEELHRQMEQQAREQERGAKELDRLAEQISTATEHASQEHSTQLTKILETLIKARDMQVADKKQNMTEARQHVVQQLQAVDATRRQAYAARCHMEQQEEQLQRLQTQLESLRRHKQVAVETGQLGRAARAADQIRQVEDSLREAETILTDRQQAAKDIMVRLSEQEHEADALEKTCAQIEQESGADIVATLENFREQLSDQRTNPLLERLVDLECATLALEIETTRKHQHFQQDMNLLQIDDEPAQQ